MTASRKVTNTRTIRKKMYIRMRDECCSVASVVTEEFFERSTWNTFEWSTTELYCYPSAPMALPVYGGIFDVRPMTLLAIDDDPCHLQIIEINFLSKLGRIGNSDETKRCWILFTLKGGREVWHDMLWWTGLSSWSNDRRISASFINLGQHKNKRVRHSAPSFFMLYHAEVEA